MICIICGMCGAPEMPNRGPLIKHGPGPGVLCATQPMTFRGMLKGLKGLKGG